MSPVKYNISADNFDQIYNRAKTTDRTPVVATSTGQYSFGIVNSRHNGKRLTFSKALVKKLGLEDEVQFFPMPEDHVLFVGKTLALNGVSVGTLSGDENRKICYSGPIVAEITNAFGLDFSNKTSTSFADMSFKEIDGVTIAAISVYDKPSKGAPAS